MDKYIYGDKTYTRDELKTQVQRDAQDLDEDQWLFGTFEFDEWLSDSIATGTVQKV